MESFVVPMCGRKRGQTANLSYRYALYPGWISSRRFCQQMRKDNIDFSLVQQELVHIKKKEAKGKLRGRLLEVIRGPVTQLVMCSLVLIDALIVTAEIILEIHAVKAEKLSLEHELRHQQRRISELKVEVLNAKQTILEKHIEILESSCIQLGMSKEQLLLCRPNVTNVGEDMTKNAVRSMAFLTSEMLAQFAVGPMPSQLVPKNAKQGLSNSNNGR
nr:unnamed protein product [Spirometra erinaceieuropaei]